MPLQQILPTWLAWNNANFLTRSGITDLRTGQDFPAGGLDVGDYFDATEREANQCSYAANGLLHHGRYRLVQVDSGATVANVKTGTVGYLRAGMTVQGAIVTAAGSGATNGSYTIPVPAGSGGGSGAVISVAVSGGVVTAVSVLQGGFNYSSVPTITSAQIAAVTGGSGMTVALQLNSTPNIVTSYDQANTAGTLIRPVVFLNPVTPGNFGFIQELGLATVMCGASAGTANTGDWVNAGTGGVVTTTASSGSPVGLTIGQAIDKPAANQLFKAYLNEYVYQD